MTDQTRAHFIAALDAEPHRQDIRAAFADWLEESGHPDLAEQVRAGNNPFSPKKEIDLAAILQDDDWAEVFGDESSGNTNKKTDACPPGSDVDISPPSRADVAEVLATVNGENDGDDWVGVFKLNDGRFLLAYGGCDYTGWD